MEKVIVYSGKGCSMCGVLKEYLDSKEVEYEVIDVKSSPEQLKAFIAKGYAAIPVLERGDEVIIGFDKDKLDDMFR